MPRRRADSPQALAVLRELLADPSAERHGYELAKATCLASGTLYPILMRFEERRLLEARWELSPKPRHVYRLTPEGREHAEARLAGEHVVESRRTAVPASKREALA